MRQRKIMFGDLKKQKREFEEHKMSELKDRVDRLKAITMKKKDYGRDLLKIKGSFCNDKVKQENSDSDEVTEEVEDRDVFKDPKLEKAIDFEIKRYNNEKEIIS